jgi:NADPH2:quinone reductase
MRACRLHAFGGPEVLAVEACAVPTPGDGEVRIAVHAAGLNFADTERRRGLYLAEQPLPDILGFEGAGVVEALGSGVEPSWLGRRVAFLAPRAHAEACVVPVAKLIALPDALDFVMGAAFPVQALTAWHLAHTVATVRSGEVVLVHSAAGGVGQFLVQLLAEVGAHVIGSVSREAKAGKALALGARRVLVRDAGFVEALLAETGGRGVDVVLEAIGRDVAAEVPRCLAPFGRWVQYGTSSGEPQPLATSTLYEKALSVHAYWLRAPHAPDAWAAGVEGVLARLVDGRLRLEVSVAPLDEAARAHRRLEAGLTTGKWVLRTR